MNQCSLFEPAQFNRSKACRFSIIQYTVRRPRGPCSHGKYALSTSTFRAFLHSVCQSKELAATFVGKSKDQTDEVDSDLVLADVCSSFGQFTKFYVEDHEEASSVDSTCRYHFLCITL